MLSYLTGGINQEGQEYVPGASGGAFRSQRDEDAGERFERMTLAEERAKLDLVRQQLSAEDSNWHWSTDSASRVAQQTWLLPPDKDKRNHDADSVLKSTYDPRLRNAVFAENADLDSIRKDTKFLYPPRWYDSWTPNFLVGNNMHRLLGDSRIRNLDDKVECAQLLSRAEAHRDERNSHRQRMRLTVFIAVYALLFAAPVALEMASPVTSVGCHSLGKGSVDADSPCTVRPHSMIGFWFALLMLIVAKVATVNVDWQWWSRQFPDVFHWLGEKLPSLFAADNLLPADDIDWWGEHLPAVLKPGEVKYLEREFAPIVPWIGFGISIPCFIFGFILLGIAIILWGLAHVLQDFIRYFLHGQGKYATMVQQRIGTHSELVQRVLEYVAWSILYSGDLLLAWVHYWGPFVAGMIYVLTHFTHFSLGQLEVAPSAGKFFIMSVGSSAGPDGCMLLEREQVVPFAYSYFGTAYVALFMLGAATLSLAEFLKLKKEDSYLLKGWADTDGLFSLNDVLVRSPVLSGLTKWKLGAESKINEFEEALPNTTAKFLKTNCGGAMEKHQGTIEALGVKPDQPSALSAQNQAAAAKFMQEDLKKVFAEGTSQVLPDAFKPEALQVGIRDLLMAVDFETTAWPGVVTALAFVFWATLEGTMASPCLMSPGDGCTSAFRFVYGWTGICGSDEYVLGTQTLALLFIFAVSAMVITARIAQTTRGIQVALQIAGDIVFLLLGLLLLLMSSGLHNTLSDISASALPIPIPSWIRNFLLVTFLVALVVLLILGAHRLEEELDKRFLRYRSFCPGSLSALVVFLYILLYTFAQGAFHFQNHGGDKDYHEFIEKQTTPAQAFADDFRILVFRLLLVLAAFRLFAYLVGRLGLTAPSPLEAERFAEKALLPEALGIIDSVRSEAVRAATLAPGIESGAWVQEAAWMRQCTKHKVQAGVPRRWRRQRPNEGMYEDLQETSHEYDQDYLLDSARGAEPHHQEGLSEEYSTRGGPDTMDYDPHEDPFLSR